MARRRAGRGRLIAIEGTRGKEVADAGLQFARLIRARGLAGGVSRWDASGLFFELRLGKRRHLALTPRSLVLLYAADLAFRLRWEIRPGLLAGHVVVAAPYVETATAFGLAAGLRADWLASLFRFAHPPDARFRSKEPRRRSGWKGRLIDGFGEFCGGVLALGPTPLDPPALRLRMVSRFDRLEQKGEWRRITKNRAQAALG